MGIRKFFRYLVPLGLIILSVIGVIALVTIAKSKRPVALPPGVGLTSNRAVASNAAVLVLNVGCEGCLPEFLPRKDKEGEEAEREKPEKIEPYESKELDVLPTDESTALQSSIEVGFD